MGSNRGLSYEEKQIDRIYSKTHEMNDINRRIELYKKRVECLKENRNLTTIDFGGGLVKFSSTFKYDTEVFNDIHEFVISSMVEHIKELENQIEGIFPQKVLESLEDLWETSDVSEE